MNIEKRWEMKFELDGKTYTTRTRLVEYAEIVTKGDNGEEMLAYFRGLPMFPSLTDVAEFMKHKGAKVVAE